MKLLELLQGVEGTLTGGTPESEISCVCFDSREKIEKNGIFICISGAIYDGHQYAVSMAQKGAGVIVAEREIPELPEGTALFLTKDTRAALSLISANWFSHPAKRLITIGITGTKGKTTSAFLIRKILNEAGMKTGMIGTVEIDDGKTVIESNHSTPESFFVQQYFHQMAENGCKAVVMEVSSQGLKQSRVAGITFDYGIFTNLSPDHIAKNEHPDFADYCACKAKLFQNCRVGIFNADDPHMPDMLKNATCERVFTFGIDKEADLRAVSVDLHQADHQPLCTYQTKGMFETAIRIPIPGLFSVYNSLTAAITASCLLVSQEQIAKSLEDVAVRGRMERVPVSDKFTVLIDYAHNAMSLSSLLTALRLCQPKRLICLFGCGGNRARDRRFDMGEISSKLCDLTIITSDNPRFEEPEDIVNDIETGAKRSSGAYVKILDRAEAIRYALLQAKEGDLIVLAGKGQETYQEIKGVKYPMDDRELVQRVIQTDGPF